MRRSRWWIAAVALCLVAGCSSDGDTDSARDDASTSTTDQTVEDAEVLRIVVSNDDGIGAEGFDQLVEALVALSDVEVHVVAPAEDHSGSGDTTTDGEVDFGDGTTASGEEGTAVEGFPADTVAVALDDLGLEPHVVVSGVNVGQNIGPIVPISGTVGVARTAIRRGVPAIAASGGLVYDAEQFAVAVELVTEWLIEHRDALIEGTVDTDTAISINVPVCDPEDMGEAVEVPRAEAFPEGVNPFESRCDQSGPAPHDDYEALAAGFPTITRIPAEL